LLPAKPLFDRPRGLNDIIVWPIVERLLLAVWELVGSLELSMPTIPVAFEDKTGMRFSLGGDAMVKFPLLVGRVAVAQAEMALVRSIPTLCSTGSFGHNLVITDLEKLQIVIVIGVKVTFQTPLPVGNRNHCVGCLALVNHSHFSLDGRLCTASMPVELCTAVL